MSPAHASLSPAGASLARQPLLDEAIPASERPVRELRELTFVIVDLETTGGSPAGCDITEIGAVKVRGGEVLGEFATLVRPSAEIPPFISVLTGITDAMVASSPRPSAVLPAFLEFARGCVLVAHNAPFDMGFLRAGCEQLGLTWPAFEVVDTALLARRILTRDETPNCKLATLALYFRAAEQPCHRALADARATVDVLHGLFERLGPLGVTTMDELRTFTGMVPAAVRRKRHLADGLPDRPGRLPLPRRPGAGALHRHVAQRPHPGAHRTSRRASCAPGWPRWSASPSGSTRCPAPIRSRRRCASCA